MAKHNQHVVPHQGDWAVKGEGNSRATSVYNTQAEAVAKAREIAKNNQSELVIHRQDGTIRDKDSFGNDNCPPEDKVH